MSEVIMWWWIIESLFTVTSILSLVGSLCFLMGVPVAIFYIIFKDDSGEDGRIARNSLRPIKTLCLGVAAVSFVVCVATPPKELAYTFVAVKAGEEFSQTDIAGKAYEEVEDIYGLAKDYLRQQTQEPEQ